MTAPFRKVVSNLSAIDTSSEDKTQSLETMKQVLGQILQFLETTRQTENVLEDQVETAQSTADSSLGAYQNSYYGEDLSGSVTNIQLMGANDSPLVGVPFTRAVTASNVAVNYTRLAGAAPGDWTLHVFKNDVEVATFTVPTT